MSATSTTTEPDWRPKAIIFDLLTALTDSWSLWDASTPSATSAEGRLWRERYLKLTFGAGTYVPYEDLVKESARDVGLPSSAAEALLRNWGALQAWPETGQVLRKLKGLGYKLGVVTNCSKDLGHRAAREVEQSVREGGAEDFTFDAVVTAEESGFYKPVKAAYQAILTAMDLEPSDVLFVAGSAGDVQGATDAGMKVVWHNRIGLAKIGEAVPLREGKTLDDTLKDFFIRP
ncbi:HAD-like protein [Hypoxylon sp. NC0597]|nr:HAD-like protein [Hypoxylon sp. NC0597]